MRNAILIATAAMAGASSGSVAAASSCHSIPMDLSGPRPTVMMRMNGRPPIKAIFDTGNMSTAVDLGQAKELGLMKSGPLELFNQHATEGYQTLLKSVFVGDLPLGNVSAAAMPAMMPGMAAVLGPLAFGKRLVTLDFSRSQLRICPNNSANRPSGQGEPYTAAPVVLPAVPIIIGTERLAGHIDTGSPFALSFPMSFSKTFKLSEPLKKIGIARSHFGEQPIYRSTIVGPVQVGPVTLQSPQAYFSDVVPNPNVGGELLRRMVITVDPAAKRAWTAPSDIASPTKP